MAQTFFISDCHLDESRPQLIDAFVRFVHEYALSGDALYILGDLFDYWIGDDAPLGLLTPIVHCLREASEKIPIHFMHGNRDFLIDKHFAQSSGCHLLGATEIINLHGQRTLLMHGDLLCTDDRSYQRYRKFIRNPLSRATIVKLPLKIRLSIAQRLRNVSKQVTASKKPEIMDVNNNTIADYMRRFNVEQIIHGHTHRPGIHTTEIGNQKWKRIVLGDWYNHGSFLVVEDGVAKLGVLET